MGDHACRLCHAKVDSGKNTCKECQKKAKSKNAPRSSRGRDTSRVSDEARAQIKKLYSQFWSIRAIAEHLGLSYSMVRKITKEK